MMILISEMLELLVLAVSFLVLSTAVVELVARMVSCTCIGEFQQPRGT
ncbi:hypothetical protein AB2N04_13465 [Nitratireductor sp. GISD-1A_MAKvit]